MASGVGTHHIVFAIITGLLPSFIWLFFWLRRDRTRPEPTGLLVLCFTLGAAGIPITIALQKFIYSIIADEKVRLIWLALIEEVIKFLPVYFIALKSKFNDEVIDPAIYMITSALGFAALENLAYATRPEFLGNIAFGLQNSSLRFFGATLLHGITSGFVGIVIGLAPRYTGWFFGLFGLGMATFLHATFNFFIMKVPVVNNVLNLREILPVYGYLWVAAVIIVLTLEKLRRIKPISSVPTQI